MVEVFLTLDVNDPERMINFWSALLDYTLEGEARFEAPEQVYWSLVDRAGVGPRIVIQRVPEPVSAKTRLHLDIRVPDMESEAHRAVSLGARRIDVTPLTEVDTTWIRLTDPEGNVFCIIAEAQARQAIDGPEVRDEAQFGSPKEVIARYSQRYLPGQAIFQNDSNPN